jgi:hypothetical protein
MWSVEVVVEAPLVDLPLGVVEACEPVEVQTLVAELAIEAFDEAVFNGLAGGG